MNRRGFLSTLVGGVALATARTFPFRVYSFASKIETPKLKVYSFKDVEGLFLRTPPLDFIATGEQLDALAKLHGIERKATISKGTRMPDLHLDVETDASLRERIISMREETGIIGPDGEFVVRGPGGEGILR
jgi:hypothetical protein